MAPSVLKGKKSPQLNVGLNILGYNIISPVNVYLGSVCTDRHFPLRKRKPEAGSVHMAFPVGRRKESSLSPLPCPQVKCPDLPHSLKLLCTLAYTRHRE